MGEDAVVAARHCFQPFLTSGSVSRDSHVFKSVDHSAALVSGHDEVYVYEVMNVRGVKYDGEIVAESEVVYESVVDETVVDEIELVDAVGAELDAE